MSDLQSETVPIRIKLFAVYQEVIGKEEIELEVAQDTCVGEVLDQIIRQYPALQQWRSQTRFGINHDFAEASTRLQPQDEVVFVPPVSGG